MATDIVTQISQPWAAQEPYLKFGFQRAQHQFLQGGPKYYSGSTVAPMGQQTNQALNNIYGMQGSPLQAGANQYAQQVMGGKYLNSNPYLDKMYQNAAGQVTRQFNESVLPGVSAKFGMSGRTGSPGMMNAVGTAYNELGQGLTGMAANMYGQNYANERGLQQGMAQFAPQLLQSQAGLYQNALQAGQIRDDQSQRELSDKVARFQFEQERPYANLRNYMGNISGNYGGSQQTASPAYSTPWWQYALGGAGLLGGMFGG